MKGKALVVAGAVLVLAAGAMGRRYWVDTHPHYETQEHALGGYSIRIPSHWPAPTKENSFVAVKNSPTLQEGSLDQFGWALSIFDEGTSTTAEAVIADMLKTSDERPVFRTVRLNNGIEATTWTEWVSRGELSQEQRSYVFKAPNGHVYAALYHMGIDGTASRRYGNLFRAVLGSMKFKS